MATYDFNFYLISPYSAGFTTGVGDTFFYTGPSTADGYINLTDSEAGGEGTVLDDNVAADQELAVGNIVDIGTTTYTNVPVSADACWTLYDPIDDVTFEVVLLSVDVPKGGSLSYTLSEYPLVADREYTVIQFDNQPDYSDGDPVFNYTDYVCFAAGTLIDTPMGWRAVETLGPGDQVVTLDGGSDVVRWVGSARVGANGLNAPVRIAAGVFGNRRDLLVSQQHRLLLTSWAVELATGEGEALAAAKHLTGLPGVSLEEGGHVTYVHVLLDQHNLLNADGAWAESFHPGKQGEMRLSREDRGEICLAVPRCVAGFEAYGPSARLSLKAHEARTIVSLLGGSVPEASANRHPALA